MQILASYKEIVLAIAFIAWCAIARTRRTSWSVFLGVQLLLALVVELAGKWTGQRNIPNQWLYNLYMLAEHSLLFVLILQIGRGLVRTLPWGVVGAFAVFGTSFVLDTCASGSLAVFASNALLVGGLLLGGLASWVMLAMAYRSPLPLMRRSEFWILLSIVVYFLCIAPMLGLYNYLYVRNPVLAEQVYRINDVLFLLRYGLVAVAMTIFARSPREE